MSLLFGLLLILAIAFQEKLNSKVFLYGTAALAGLTAGASYSGGWKLILAFVIVSLFITYSIQYLKKKGVF